MKRAIVLVAGVLVLAAPAGAATWGPGDSGVSPAYCPQQILVVDMIYDQLGPIHQAKWVAGRNQAFAEWGLPFAISTAHEVVPFTDDNATSGAAQANFAQCTITIIKDKRTAPGDQGGLIIEPSAGGVILNPWSGWWQSQSNVSSVVAHETGHALGFWHGGTGVMSGSSHVNQEERDLARIYYEAQGFIF